MWDRIGGAVWSYSWLGIFAPGLLIGDGAADALRILLRSAQLAKHFSRQRRPDQSRVSQKLAVSAFHSRRYFCSLQPGFQEMLLQSHRNMIEVFPRHSIQPGARCNPFTDFRGRGAFSIKSATMVDFGAVSQISIKSEKVRCILRPSRQRYDRRPRFKASAQSPRMCLRIRDFTGPD